MKKSGLELTLGIDSKATMPNNQSNVPVNKELKRYYLYNFLRSLVKIKGSYFAMAYFYFHGFPASAVVLNIIVYSVTCLLIIKPISKLIGTLGIKKTFILHSIPVLISFFIVTNISLEWSSLFYLWMFVHAFAVMLYRIPLTAYFSHYGNHETRGKEVGLANVVQKLASVAGPILFGALIDQTGLVVFFAIKTLIHFAAAFVLGLKNDSRVKVDTSIFKLSRIVPRKVSKAFFFSQLPYPFVSDLFFIWVTLKFGSFTLAGIFISAKVALEILLS
ncbi:MAG TPA: MFS transporter, partial [Candidatus Marinimicrobia bacterium]|nr:MFS transporter [Candidatus Neomarinimicrobiota bacterium]